MARRYESLPFGTLTLRDHLALDRNILANERTLLAYARTGFATIVAGLSFMQFFEGSVYVLMGWACVVLGLGTFALGVYRFRKMRVTRWAHTYPQRAAEMVERSSLFHDA